MLWLSRIFATGFGVGTLGIVPGTLGTILALVIFGCLRQVFPTLSQPLPGFLLSLAVLVVALQSAHIVLQAKCFGEDATDPGEIVIDEVVGFAFAIIALDTAIIPLLLAFICFRAFDILKPWPISSLERLPGTFGVVVDDVGAGILANVTTLGLLYLFQ